MAQRRRVLVPLGTDDNDGNFGHGEAHFARRNYLERLFEANLLPIMISPFTESNEAIEILRECHGLFLMGGDDMNATHFNEENHSKNVLVIPERDELELALTRYALENRIPLLGICRGCQVMAVATGGKLEQHLPDTDTAITHSLDTYSRYHEWVSSLEHAVLLEPDSTTAKILGEPEEPLIINSAHHQAIKSIEQPFQVSAAAEDGTIEIIEHQDPSQFAFGIQSHPEVDANSTLSPFFRAFETACQ